MHHTYFMQRKPCEANNSQFFRTGTIGGLNYPPDPSQIRFIIQRLIYCKIPILSKSTSVKLDH